MQMNSKDGCFMNKYILSFYFYRKHSKLNSVLYVGSDLLNVYSRMYVWNLFADDFTQESWFINNCITFETNVFWPIRTMGLIH